MAICISPVFVCRGTGGASFVRAAVPGASFSGRHVKVNFSAVGSGGVSVRMERKAAVGVRLSARHVEPALGLFCPVDYSLSCFDEGWNNDEGFNNDAGWDND